MTAKWPLLEWGHRAPSAVLAPCPHPSIGMHELSASVFCPFRSPSEISSLDYKVLEFLEHLLCMWTWARLS